MSNHPHPDAPPEGPARGPSAVHDKDGNKVPSLNLPSLATTPIPTFPLRGKEATDAMLRAFEHSLPFRGLQGEGEGGGGLLSNGAVHAS